ncbi:MAG: patatin [Betaproteobacteria bacterium]|nr:MAG: patatin [Betaproteobacteria bacterium]
MRRFVFARGGPQGRVGRAATLAGVLLALTSLLAGCAPFNYVAPDAPIASSTVARMMPPPRIAVVLGSGGPRGYAHVGFIKVIEQAGITPDLIVGSSVGSLIGAFWASGMSAVDIEAKALSGGPLTLFDPNPFADRGWIRGQKLQDYVANELSTSALEQLKRRLVVVATRRDDKTAAFFLRGNVSVAVRASSAVPKVISPVGISGVEYEDGDESLPLAVKAARDAGAQFVIAVDVSAVDGSAPPGVSPDWLIRDAKRRSRIAPEVAQADFLIHPDMGYFASPRREFFLRAQAAGERETTASLPELLSLLKARGLR